ncbi:hypothetical protein [Caballeronia sp. dw_19]|uniref:hypothetical protein n=1 Tax=Caballeronia sp. dw_19 TaxID=2719791 RepID=UPI001BCD34B2|nr:hypothetical protein [Caballeronia sp. dw_19]
MNCKPDELACVVRLPEVEDADLRVALQEQVLGRVVRVVALIPQTADTWLLADPFTLKLPIAPLEHSFDFQVTGLEDHLLQPIRGVPVCEEKRDEVPA